jgi:phosphate transport system substrate-binding protein
MWQQEKKDSSIINLALLLAFATTPMAVALFMSMPVLAKSTTYTSFFPLPQTVEKGTIIRVDGSSDLMKINQSLKEDFEQQFYGTKIDIGVNGNEAALKALQDGKIDVAAITRKLTPEEKSQGLEQVILYREKIAIIVGVNNPFQGSLTKKQLAGIFTGEIRDWSQLGGTARPIRVINYPPDTDIRNAFQSSSIFKTKIGTGANVTELPLENITEIIQKLGNDGISYVLANQVSQVQNVRAIQLNSTDLNQSNSSISMPLVYVYKKNHSQGVSSFLGFTLARPGQEAIDTARKIESSSVAISALQSFAMETSSGNYNESSNYLKPEVSPTVTNAVTTSITAAPTSRPTSIPTTSTPTNAATLAPTSVAPTSAPTGFNVTNNEQQFVQPLNHSTEDKNELPIFLLPLLLVLSLGALALRLIGKKRTTAYEETETDYSVSDASLVLDNQQNNSNGTVKLTEDTAIPPSNNVADNLSPNGVANLEQVAKNDQEDLKDSEQSDSLNSGEVIWDIEAPVAVVSTPYHQILNIPELGFGEEFTNSLLEPPDIPAVAPADNSPISLSELLGIPAVASVNNSPTSLSELLGIPAVASVNNNITTVNNSDSPTSLSELLDVSALTIDNSSNNSGSALSKLISSPGALSINNPPSALSELLDITTIGSIDSSPSYLLDLLDLPVAIPIDNSPSALSELLGVPGVQPDVDVADSLPDLDFPVVEETEPDTTDILTDSPVSNLDLDFPVVGEIKEIETETETSHPSESTSENIALVESKIIETPSITDSTHEQAKSEEPKQNNIEGANLSILDNDSNIILTPRTPKWAYISWYVSEASQKVVQNQNLALAVRIYDVTHLDLSYQSPQLVQQYECEEETHDRYVAIPINDRDYIAEIGYCNQENNWFCIARSGLVRIFSRPRTDLWIATDTELVIYGATEPGTKVTIDGQNIQLKSDGTFQIHLPFIDSEVGYLFTATSSSGEQTKTINKKFSQVSN